MVISEKGHLGILSKQINSLSIMLGRSQILSFHWCINIWSHDMFHHTGPNWELGESIKSYARIILLNEVPFVWLDGARLPQISLIMSSTNSKFYKLFGGKNYLNMTFDHCFTHCRTTSASTTTPSRRRRLSRSTIPTSRIASSSSTPTPDVAQKLSPSTSTCPM